jgi:hypothetical protein
MTEEVQDAQPTGEAEAQELPTPEISAGSTDAGSAQPGLDVETLADKILERLEPVVDDKVDARFKSGKDTRFSKVEEIAAWVKESGGDFEKVRGALTESQLLNRIDALEAQISGGAVGTAPAGNFQADIDGILKEAGFDPHSPEAMAIRTEWSKSQYPSETDALKGLTRHTVKAVKQGNVTAAAAVSPSGSPAPIEDGSYEGLAAELAAMRGQFDPETNKKRREIREKMDELQGSLPIQEAKRDAFGDF